MKEIILSNKGYCKKCDTEIESYNRHDFVSCKCGQCAVDGGHDYLRRVGNPIYFEERSITCKEGEWDKCAEHLKWGTYGKDGTDPLTYVYLKDCDIEHLQNILDNCFISNLYKQTILHIIEEKYKKLGLKELKNLKTLEDADSR